MVAGWLIIPGVLQLVAAAILEYDDRRNHVGADTANSNIQLQRQAGRGREGGIDGLVATAEAARRYLEIRGRGGATRPTGVRAVQVETVESADGPAAACANEAQILPGNRVPGTRA